MTESKPLWIPSAERIASSRMTAFTRAAERATNLQFADYDALWRWSIDDSERFWSLLWDFCDVIGERGQRTVLNRERMPGARWFPDARLNLAENLLRDDFPASQLAVVFWGEDRVRRSLTRGDLRQHVAKMAAAMRAAGVGVGDRVAALLPNIPETLVITLAALSLGAIVTTTSPDFGVQGVLDRFGQTRPKLLFAVDGYWYNRKRIDCLTKTRTIAAQLADLTACIVVPYLDTLPNVDGIAHGLLLEDFLRGHANTTRLDFIRLPFDHPAYVLYSSGTTGLPKGIVHSAGGILLQHLKEHQLHCDIHAGDRFFYFTTCGWMMWNYLISGLASGASLLLYDGSPLLDQGRILFRFADAERMTHLGTSAKWIDTIAKNGLAPRREFHLDAVRVIMSTGSPLAPESFDYVYRDIKDDVLLASISGGTDICSCFVTGNPNLPVWRGEIQCRGLGMAVDVFDDSGRSVREQRGELVCTQSFPAMPVGFYNDPDGKRYRAAYFERFPGVWCHGDFCELTAHGGMIIYGRSDSVLNPGGVRIGTAEIYREVEKLPQILESVAIAQEWQGDVRVVLFVKLRPGVKLDTALENQIRDSIRQNTTPRHVPAKILGVDDIPRTRSGKIVEIAVREAVHGRPVKNIEALANPESLEFFRNRPELQEP